MLGTTEVLKNYVKKQDLKSVPQTKSYTTLNNHNEAEFFKKRICAFKTII